MKHHWCHKTHQEHISPGGQGEVSCRCHLFLYDQEGILPVPPLPLRPGGNPASEARPHAHGRCKGLSHYSFYKWKLLCHLLKQENILAYIPSKWLPGRPLSQSTHIFQCSVTCNAVHHAEPLIHISRHYKWQAGSALEIKTHRNTSVGARGRLSC